MNNQKSFHQILYEICLNQKINLKELSFGWIFELEKNGKIRHIIGSRFDMNYEASGNIACDKFATFEVLKSHNVPVVKHTILFNPNTRSNYVPESGNSKIISSEFKRNGSLVVKPNTGSEGQGVFLCHSLKETESAVLKLFKRNDSIDICPYYDIKTEFRTFYLNGKILLIYAKCKPFVVGNGVDSLGVLINNLDLPDTPVSHDNLKKLDLLYVPKQDEIVEISWKHNLSGGATPQILEKSDLYSKIESLALDAGNAMNMSFATIDIIQTTDNNFYVLEINSGIGTSQFIKTAPNGFEIMKKVYSKALEEMFK